MRAARAPVAGRWRARGGAAAARPRLRTRAPPASNPPHAPTPPPAAAPPPRRVAAVEVSLEEPAAAPVAPAADDFRGLSYSAQYDKLMHTYKVRGRARAAYDKRPW